MDNHLMTLYDPFISFTCDQTYNLKKNQQFSIYPKSQQQAMKKSQPQTQPPQQKQKQKQKQNNKLNEQLIDASKTHNYKLVQSLIKKGANVNYIRYMGANSWYRGDSHTALYDAVHEKFDGEKNYVDVIELLLENGADPNFQATCGGWNHSSKYPLFTGIARILTNFQSQQQKIRFLTTLSKHGIKFDQPSRQGRSKNSHAYNYSTCFIFQVMDSVGMGSRLRELAKMMMKSGEIGEVRKMDESGGIQGLFDEMLTSEEQKKQEQRKEQLKSQTPPPNLPIPNPTLLKTILSLGTNPNSSRSSSTWSNSLSEDPFNSDHSYELIQFFQHKSQQFETVLHRAIMYDQVQLVQILLEKGADVRKECRFTVRVPVYPYEWPQCLREFQMRENQMKIKYAEKQKASCLKKLKENLTEEERERYRKIILVQQLAIEKALRYTIQGDSPIERCKTISMNCLELVQAFKANAQIVKLINQRKPLKQQQQKQKQ